MYILLSVSKDQAVVLKGNKKEWGQPLLTGQGIFYSRKIKFENRCKF